MSVMSEWLESIGLGSYASLLSQNAIDLEIALTLTNNDFAQLGIPLGDRKRLLTAIDRDRSSDRAQPDPVGIGKRRHRARCDTDDGG